MERVELGRTGLQVSPAGLGCGGHSRLGMREGKDQSIAAKVIDHALELGINFFDTARAYGTEEVLGKCVSQRRDKVVISSKAATRSRDGWLDEQSVLTSLEKSLQKMQTDYIDVFSLHGVLPAQLDVCLERFLPLLQKQVELGKIRYLGITESFMEDPKHEMLSRAIESDQFDVVMVGFNFLNTGARESVFQPALDRNIATLVMHAVRRALSDQDVLVKRVMQSIESGEIEESLVNVDDPVGFLAAHPEVLSVTEAAYRYCHHEPGANVVLTGTGSPEHLTANVGAINASPLPEELVTRLDEIFGRVESLSGD